ncbi:MAG: hypothetical protein IAE82_19415 [Opitutaceae bacterium]|nr:hypothetical protein [Opitutaceae bacterium]
MMTKSWTGRFARGGVVLAVFASSVLRHAAAPPAFIPPIDVEVPATIPPEVSNWRYATCDGVEVLAAAGEESTRIYVENIALQRANLDAILPRDLRISWDRPITVVLYGVENPRPMPGIFGPMLSKVYTDRERERAAENREGKPLEVRVEPRIMPGAFVADADAIAVFNIVQPKVKASELSGLPASSYVTYLLQSRTPPLPAWFIDGLTAFFAQATVTGADLDLPPFTWISPAQTQLMLKDKSMPVEFLPMAEVFAHVNHATLPADERRKLTVRSQAALLVRWCLEGRAAGGPESLWKFVRGVRPGVDLEAHFSTCFGMSTADAVDAMRAFLPGAIRKPARVRLARAGRLPPVEVRAATPAEVARITGEWSRLAARMAGDAQPVLRSFYDEVARRSVAVGPDNATADPELLAGRGLVAVDTGDDTTALPLLEAACAAPHPRPRAVVERARIRLAQAKAGLAPDGRLDVAAIAAIVDPLRDVLAARPPMARAYQVMAEAWTVAETPPSEADLALLAAGVETVPGDASLVIAAARLFMDVGWVEQAGTAVENGLAYVTDAASRRRLYAFRSAVRAAAPKKTP